MLPLGDARAWRRLFYVQPHEGALECAGLFGVGLVAAHYLLELVFWNFRQFLLRHLGKLLNG